MLLGRLPDPPLGDDRAGIVLRPWRATVTDAAALAAAWADPAVAAANPPPADRTEAAALAWIRGDADRRAAGVVLDLVVAAGGDDAVLGEVGLRNADPAARRAEVGWWIAPDHRGRGLAAVAVGLVAGWALGPPYRLRQVWARIDPANAASAVVARRAGFTRLGTAAGAEVWARMSR